MDNDVYRGVIKRGAVSCIKFHLNSMWSMLLGECRTLTLCTALCSLPLLRSNHGGVKVSLVVKTMLIRGYTKVLL